MDPHPSEIATPVPDSFSQMERVVLGAFRRWVSIALRPVVLLLQETGVKPTAVSLSQIPLGFTAAALIVPAPYAALALFLVTLLLDAIDGALARATHQVSAFGALADQVADHIRELTIIGGLVAAGALRGEIGVAYAALYPLSNFMVYASNRHGARIPLAVKTWLVFYPFLIAYLAFGTNLLNYAGAAAGAFMALSSMVALVGLRGRMNGTAG